MSRLVLSQEYNQSLLLVQWFQVKAFSLPCKFGAPINVLCHGIMETAFRGKSMPRFFSKPLFIGVVVSCSFAKIDSTKIDFQKKKRKEKKEKEWAARLW